MKTNTLLAALCAAAAMLAAPAHALDTAKAKQLAQSNACMGCHAVDKKLVGPAYKDVAAKYKGGDVAQLAASIKAGGAGKWGPIPMPAQARLTDADATLLAQWVMAGAPN
ncbi:c-type cytochrome [Comamonadaceae bacterium M7527]|nr:c-type cytochrome [Comamonadaceae bacterium M7527]